MNRQDVRELQQVQEYPAISVLMPVHRTVPDREQNPIRLKNLIREVERRLHEEFDKRRVQAHVEKLEALAGEVNFSESREGLALFVSDSAAQSFHLPFPVTERVIIDDTFATRDLVFTLNRSPRYWVLALSEKPTRLYMGTRDELTEVRGRGFPMTMTGPGGASRIPGGHGVDSSARRDDSHRHFFQEVDQKFGEIAGQDPLPLAVVGVERYLAFFREVSRHQDAIAATVEGNYDESPAHEIARAAWPGIESWLEKRRKDRLNELGEAVGAHRYASGITEAWRFSKEGRARTVLVEQSYACPVRVTDDAGLVVEPVADGTAPGVVDDAVDEIIEFVWAGGGDAVFVADGELSAHDRIAVILRY